MFNHKIHSKTFLLFLFTITVLLQGCGAERDTGFNPTPSSSNSSSLGAEMTVTTVYTGESPQNPYEPDSSDHKQIIIIRSVDELDAYWDAYNPPENFTLTSDDFEKGQVILYDQGNIGVCIQKLVFNTSIKAFDYTSNSAKVVFKFRDIDKPSSSSKSSNSSSSDSSSSTDSSASSSNYSEPTCDDPTVKRPYGFYYVPTRKKLLIEEQSAY